jgi:hypothetical protein
MAQNYTTRNQPERDGPTYSTARSVRVTLNMGRIPGTPVPATVPSAPVPKVQGAPVGQIPNSNPEVPHGLGSTPQLDLAGAGLSERGTPGPTAPAPTPTEGAPTSPISLSGGGTMPAISFTSAGRLENVPPFLPPPVASPVQPFRFLMTGQGLPGAMRLGAVPSGEVLLTGRPGEGYAIAGSIYGMPGITDRTMRPTLWLLHDLTVPLNLDPSDLAALPRGNQPGFVFTQDGRPPSYGPQANVITIAVPVGTFEPTSDGLWQVHAQLTPAVNQTFHPLAALGPNQLPDPNQPLPSGTMTGILTDLFLRPASVLQHLRVKEHHADRLRAICQIAASRPPAFLDGAHFSRVAVTLEGPVRSTPDRLPTTETLILLGNNRAQVG